MLSQSFDIENNNRENRNRILSATVAVTIHTLLLLGLFFWYISTPDPPLLDNQGGMTVNYGTSDVGTGDQQQFTAVPVKVVAQTESNPVTPTSSSSPDNLETQDAEDAPVVEKKTEIKKKVEKPNPDAVYKPSNKPAVNTPPTPKPQVDKNALFSPGALGKPNKSKGDGEGGGQGDQGNPNGDPNSHNYHGGGTGNGPGAGGNGLGDGNVRLRGRKIINRPPLPRNNCETSTGKVNIEIKVNHSGHVVDTKFLMQGSTIQDECLINLASQFARKYIFDENAAGADIQTGQITVVFGEH